MKKILLGLSLVVASTTFAAEIIPELYLMERLLLPLQNTQTYINEANGKEYKAIQVNTDTMEMLQTTENPFYVYDSTRKQKLVRKGDYFVAPYRLSNIKVVERAEFEREYRNKFASEKKVFVDMGDDSQAINPEDVDAGSLDIKE